MDNCFTVCVDTTAPASTPYYIRALVEGIYTELGLFTDMNKALDTAKQQYPNAAYVLPIQFEDVYQEAGRG